MMMKVTFYLCLFIPVGNDAENLDEGDMYKSAPDFDFRNIQHNGKFCKEKENKHKAICKKAKGIFHCNI